MIDKTIVERQRRRWMRPNAHLWIRPDAYRFMPRNAPRWYGKDAVRYFWPELTNTDSPSKETEIDAASECSRELEIHAACDALLKLKSDLLLLRMELKLRQLLHSAKYRPDQPRVPAGNPDGGQWTAGGGNGRVRLAANEPTNLGPLARRLLALDLALRAIKIFRSDKLLDDLFGRTRGAITTTSLNGDRIFGSNSTSPTYGAVDEADAKSLRDRYLKANPDLAIRGNDGFKPNDGFFHAETNILTRAARKNGGTLAGQTLEVFGDRKMCNSCEDVLPFVGEQLGNPTVTFIDPDGKRRTMRDGVWIKEPQQ